MTESFWNFVDRFWLAIVVVVMIVAFFFVVLLSVARCPDQGYDARQCSSEQMIERLGKDVQGLRQDVYRLQTQVAEGDKR